MTAQASQGAPAIQKRLAIHSHSVSLFGFKPYQYIPLPSKTSIRLLSFREPDIGLAGPSICGLPLIQCSLKIVDLDDKPVYDALSYTWGSPFSTASSSSQNYTAANKWPIAVNDRIIYVSKNLHDALSRFSPSIESDPDVDQRSPPYNKTRLHEAAEAGRPDHASLLLRQGAVTWSRDCFGETPLHYAAENGHYKIVRMLVRAGSDINLTDSSGRTALVCCLQRKRGQHDEVAKYLRDPGSDTEDTVDNADADNYWIDAISIDQDNTLERNAQVAIMSRIYNEATSVVIWLGVEDQYTKLAHEAITRINGADQQHQGLWSAAAWRYRAQTSKPESDIDEDQVSDEHIVSIRQFGALMELLRRSWFQRVWVIQEFSLARSIKMFVGEVELRYVDFFELIQHRLGDSANLHLVSDKQTPPVKWGKGSPGTEAWTLTDIRLRTRTEPFERNHLEHFIRQLQLTPEPHMLSPLSLSVLLTFTWNSRASDPRDKIFGLLSIARPIPGEDPIIADYNTPTEDLYTQVARRFLLGADDWVPQDWISGQVEALEPLEGLSFIQEALDPVSMPRTPNLPSWCPDFNTETITSRLFPIKRFNAATALPPTIYPLSSPSDNRVLTLSAKPFDEIVQIENKPPESPIGHGVRYEPHSWFSLALNTPEKYATGIPRVEALWRTLMLDNILEDQYSETKQSFKNLIATVLHPRPPHDPSTGPVQPTNPHTFSLLTRLSESDTSNSLPTLSEIQDCSFAHGEFNHVCGRDVPFRAFHVGFLNNYRGRVLFRTRKGYFGLGPRSSRVGDHVWVVSGARVPFVMRGVQEDGKEEGDKFRMVGEAFALGIMGGEGVEREEFQKVDLV